MKSEWPGRGNPSPFSVSSVASLDNDQAIQGQPTQATGFVCLQWQPDIARYLLSVDTFFFHFRDQSHGFSTELYMECI